MTPGEADLDGLALDVAASQALDDTTPSGDAQEDESISGLISSFQLLDFKERPEQFIWFPKLPVEIRLAIWGLCLDAQQQQQQQRLQGLYPYDSIIFPCPAVGQVCREARNEALKGLHPFEVKLDAKDIDNERKSTLTWLDPSRDILLISSWTHSWPAWVLPFFPTARTLASSYQGIITQRDYASLLVKDIAKCSVFPALETLLVVMDYERQRQLRVDLPFKASVDADSDGKLSPLPAYPYERPGPVSHDASKSPIEALVQLDSQWRRWGQEIHFRGKRVLLDLYKDEHWEALGGISSTHMIGDRNSPRDLVEKSLQETRASLMERWEQTGQSEINQEFEKALSTLYTRLHRNDTAAAAAGSESDSSREEWMDEKRKRLPKIYPVVMVDIARRQGPVAHVKGFLDRPHQEVQAYLRHVSLSFDMFGWGFATGTPDGG